MIFWATSFTIRYKNLSNLILYRNCWAEEVCVFKSQFKFLLWLTGLACLIISAAASAIELCMRAIRLQCCNSQVCNQIMWLRPTSAEIVGRVMSQTSTSLKIVPFRVQWRSLGSCRKQIWQNNLMGSLLNKLPFFPKLCSNQLLSALPRCNSTIRYNKNF